MFSVVSVKYIVDSMSFNWVVDFGVCVVGFDEVNFIWVDVGFVVDFLYEMFL